MNEFPETLEEEVEEEHWEVTEAKAKIIKKVKEAEDRAKIKASLAAALAAKTNMNGGRGPLPGTFGVPRTSSTTRWR